MIGVFEREIKHSITGKYYTETLEVDGISKPFNVRGKVSNGNWAVEYFSVSTHLLGTMYFWRKKEAIEWIKEIKANASKQQSDVSRTRKAKR